MQLIFGVLRSDCGNENIMKLQDNAMYVVGAYVNGVLSDQVWKLEF